MLNNDNAQILKMLLNDVWSHEKCIVTTFGHQYKYVVFANDLKWFGSIKYTFNWAYKEENEQTNKKKRYGGHIMATLCLHTVAAVHFEDNYKTTTFRPW